MLIILYNYFALIWGLPSKYLNNISGLLLPSHCTLTYTGGIFLWHNPHSYLYCILYNYTIINRARTFLKLVKNLQLPTTTSKKYYHKTKKYSRIT